MKSTPSRVFAAGLAVALVLASAVSADAAPLFVPGPLTSSTSNIVTVEGASAGGNESAAAPRIDRRGRVIDDASRPGRSSGFERRGNYAYYNGHRGYRDRRDGYRYHNGFWFPLAAFAAGAIIGGAIVSSPPPPVRNPHVDWCLAHYRTYNPYDNTFQPYVGPRMVCRSPYG